MGEFGEVRRKKWHHAIVSKEKERHLKLRDKEGDQECDEKNQEGCSLCNVKVFVRRRSMGVKQWKPEGWKTNTVFDMMAMDIEKGNKGIHVGGRPSWAGKLKGLKTRWVQEAGMVLTLEENKKLGTVAENVDQRRGAGGAIVAIGRNPIYVYWDTWRGAKPRKKESDRLPGSYNNG
ncbi:hypothetical protein C7212DRAFT_346921 [Tuber magnatum]|uniref:Uncharacterized protein n=1 Tax=Tuber magnatum TaxID=42249 RepID=A0A317SJA7_9PEZI|nr:hypothetical protein C7212DRAFT_346921 [Tuber magnatum]